MKIRNLIIIVAIFLFPLVALAITTNSSAYQAGYGTGNFPPLILKIVGVAALVVVGVAYIIKEE